MSSYSSQYYTTGVPIPAKGQQYPTYYQSPESNYSVSPPEDNDASVTSGVPSYGSSGYSATTSSYAGSTSDWDSTGSASGIDFNEYIQDRFAESFDPIPLDRSLAVQAQT
jgi:biogenesis of lysosome-related organelles complex 1 subunit KXD1